MGEGDRTREGGKEERESEREREYESEQHSEELNADFMLEGPVFYP